MASFVPSRSVLIINVETGVDAKGNPVIKARRYANLKPTATADAVMTVSNAIAGLQQHALVSVQQEQLNNVATA